MQRQRPKYPRAAERRGSKKALFSEITISARTMPVRSILFALQFSKKMLASDMRAMGKIDSEKSLRHQRRLSRALSRLRAEDPEYGNEERDRAILLAVRHYVNMFYKLGPRQRSTYSAMANRIFSRIKAENNLLIIPVEMASRGIERSRAIESIYEGVIEMPVRLLYDSCRVALDVELLQSKMGIKEVPEGPVSMIKESMGILYDNALSPGARSSSDEVMDSFVNDVITASEEAGMVVPYFIAHRFSADSVMEESMRKMARKALGFELRA